MELFYDQIFEQLFVRFGTFDFFFHYGWAVLFEFFFFWRVFEYLWVPKQLSKNQNANIFSYLIMLTRYINHSYRKRSIVCNRIDCWHFMLWSLNKITLIFLNVSKRKQKIPHLARIIRYFFVFVHMIMISDSLISPGIISRHRANFVYTWQFIRYIILMRFA